MSEPPKTGSRYRVGILMHASQEHMRQVALGVAHCAQLTPDWEVSGDGFHPLIPWNRLNKWKGDGIIAIVNSHEQIEILKKLNLPFVLAGSRVIDKKYSVVASNNYSIGQMAAEHLVESGFRRLVFLGQAVWDDELLRLKGFQELVEQRGLEFILSDIKLDEYRARDSSTHYRTNVDKLVTQLANFVTPFAVYCPNSVIARGLIEACNIAGLSIPEEVAIIGVNDDALECESILPAISTVVQQSRRIGFRACQYLHEMVVNHAGVSHQFLEPQGIVARQSTDVLLVDDQKVEKAMRFMRDNVGRGIGIEEVVAAVGISRRGLEVKFKQVLNRTPLSELNRVRIGKAKQLLRYSDASITAIALDSGFGSSQSFCVAFKKACGSSPTEFRRGENES